MDRSDRLTRTASVACTKGFINPPGENNCFLNSAVQVLWHLDVFRRSFRELSGHFCVGPSCIFCALKVIFTQIQYSDEAALPPDALRQALADTFKDEQRFQLNNMDDAAECLENILSRLHFHFAMNEKDEICNAAHCISHRKFAMEILEQSICKCGATSEPLPFFQLVHYVSVTALCSEAEFLKTKLKGLHEDMFGQLLKRAVNQGDMRNCPGKCGQQISVQQSLLNSPDVVCIGLIWDSDSPDIKQISQLLDCVDPVLRLPEVFPRVSDDKAKKVDLLLAGVVTYYGKHYSTFFYNSKMKTWIYFDDARVRKMGPDWEKIRDRCCKNHYQPLLLLYVNPHGKPVSTKTAPADVKLVDTTTLVVSGETTRSPRGMYANEKSKDRIGGNASTIPEPSRKTLLKEPSNGLVSSSSSHSLGSEGSVDKGPEVSLPGPKKSRRPIKRLKIVGSGIKRALSRSRNTSPTEDLQSSSLHTLNSEKVEVVPKKGNSHEDLIDLSSDVRTKNILSLYQTSSRVRETDETDSGLGSSSSQASSPATSSVSSVDTNADDLIDFTTRTFPRPSKGNDTHRVDGIIDEAEGLLRSSYELEKAGDLALSLSKCTNSSTYFRIAIDKCSKMIPNPAYLGKLKNKHFVCAERSRELHKRITAEKEASNVQFSQQQKQDLLMRQKERDQQVLRQHKQTPTINGTLPRSSNKDRDSGVQMNGVVAMTSSRSINDVYLKNDHGGDTSSSSSARRPNSRSHFPGSIGTSRTPPDCVCSQKIKPDALCYSPVHYGKTTSLSSDFERMKVAKEESGRDRKPTVTHVSTSFIPLRSLPIEKTLLTSAAYLSPNSRTSLNDTRRCSIYDNMPPSEEHRRSPLAVPVRASVSPSHPTKSSGVSENEHRKSWGAPAYIDPPPYDPSRTYQSTSNLGNQSGSLLQRFNVPRTLPDDVRRIHEDVRATRRFCEKCRVTYVERNANFCAPCQALNSMLHNLKANTAVLY